MKKVYSLIIFLLLIFIPFKINAQEGISNYYIDMTVNNNGSVTIKELIVLNGDFNGFERIINYKNNRLSSFDGSLTSFNGSDIYNADSIKLISIKDIDVDNVSFDSIYDSGTEFNEVYSAEKGDYGKYIRTVRTNGETYQIYNPDDGSKRGFYIEYILGNVGVVHNDIGEIGLNLFDELTEYVDILEMHIHIPGNKTLLRGWAHGPLTGNIELSGTDLIKVTASKVEPNNPIDVRFAFDKSVISGSKKLTNVDALDKIIEVETERANKANAERQAVREQLEEDAKSAVMVARSDPTRRNYEFALTSVNYLPTSELKTSLYIELEDVLKLVEKNEAKMGRIIIIIFAGWIIGLAFLIYYMYKKYDKEYESEFTGDYYRDFPASYGPEVLGYLLNRKITPNELSASILNLVNKKVIKVEKNLDSKKEDYTFINNSENLLDNLTLAEQKALTLLFDGESTTTLKLFKKRAKTNYENFILDYNDWKLEATNVSKNENFYETSSQKGIGILYSVLGIGLVFGLYKNYLSLLIYTVVFILSIGSLIYFISITKRTKKGNEDYRKWIGLRNFLRDFSTMDQKSLPEIALWEKYLVYAIPLGCAKKLSKDMQIKVQELGYDPNSVDMFDVAYMMHLNRVLNTSVVSTVSAAYAEQSREKMSDIASSSSSSGGGFGGGFSSGGGSFGGGGGGGRF